MPLSIHIYTFIYTSVIPKQMIGPKTNSCRHISVLRHTFITRKIVAVVYILYIEYIHIYVECIVYV